MSYFPFFVNLEGKECLLIGGGDVAYRKVRALLPFRIKIHMVAQKYCAGLLELQSRTKGELLCLEQRSFREEDLEGMLFVIAATEDRALNRRIAGLCQEKDILVNVVDDRELCSFYFPALVKQEELVVGISSGGKSPLLASKLRQSLEKQLPGYYGELNQVLGELRDTVQEEAEDELLRRKCYEEVIRQSEEQGKALSVWEAQAVVGELLQGSSETFTVGKE